MAGLRSPENVIDFHAARLRKLGSQPLEPGAMPTGDHPTTANIIPFESDSPVVHEWENDPYLGVRFDNPASILDEDAVTIDDLPAETLLDAARRNADTPRGRRYLAELEQRLFHARTRYINNTGMSDNERRKHYTDLIFHTLATGDEIKGSSNSQYGSALKRAASDLATNVFGLSGMNDILTKHALRTDVHNIAKGKNASLPNQPIPLRINVVPFQPRK